jgi:hypothetical protein
MVVFVVIRGVASTRWSVLCVWYDMHQLSKGIRYDTTSEKKIIPHGCIDEINTDTIYHIYLQYPPEPT